MTDLERRVLAALPTEAAFTARTLQTFVRHHKHDGEPSRVLGKLLQGLEGRGLVTRWDRDSPVLWMRTPAGTAAIAEMA